MRKIPVAEPENLRSCKSPKKLQEIEDINETDFFRFSEELIKNEKSLARLFLIRFLGYDVEVHQIDIHVDHELKWRWDEVWFLSLNSDGTKTPMVAYFQVDRIVIENRESLD